MRVQDAVKVLKKRGLHVEALIGPQGWRYQISPKLGLGYQISEDELLELHEQHRLTMAGIKALVEKKQTP